MSVGVLADLNEEEMSHVTGILQRQQGPVSEQALKDCVQTVLAEHQAAGVTTESDLLAIQERMRQRKGIRQ